MNISVGGHSLAVALRDAAYSSVPIHGSMGAVEAMGAEVAEALRNKAMRAEWGRR